MIASTGPLGETVLQFTHPQCASSGTTTAVVARQHPRGSTALIGVRDRPSAEAMLLWESNTQTTIEDQGNIDTITYHKLGLQPSAAGALTVDGPRLESLVLRLQLSLARVELTDHGIDAIIAEIADMGPLIPPRGELRDFERLDLSRFSTEAQQQWLAVARRRGWCLVIAGNGLGLEHPWLRVNVLLDEGRAVAGIAPVRVDGS